MHAIAVNKVLNMYFMNKKKIHKVTFHLFILSSQIYLKNNILDIEPQIHTK